MPNCFIVVDLGFGDSGKGSITDFLTREVEAGIVVRYNGSGQAGHNVISYNGNKPVHHCFSQFGAGTFAGAGTYLSKYFVLEPMGLHVEAQELVKKGINDPLSTMVIHQHAMVITPAHRWSNQSKELMRGAAAHGTCGIGLGEAMSDEPRLGAVRAMDLFRPKSEVRDMLNYFSEAKIAEIQEISAFSGVSLPIDKSRLEQWNELFIKRLDTLAGMNVVTTEESKSLLQSQDSIIFEGAQGVLLDQDYGFYPHTTWSRTSSANAWGLIESLELEGDVVTFGLVRSFMTRHGHGPFPSEWKNPPAYLTKDHNVDNGWQGSWRVGLPDMVLWRYALSIDPVDALVVSHLDQYSPSAFVEAYWDYDGFLHKDLPMIVDDPSRDPSQMQKLTDLLSKVNVVTHGTTDIVHSLEKELQKPVSIVSRGPSAKDKTFRRGILNENHIKVL